ncbi:MAG: hypothetical protein JO078_09210 [Candidatus Eremiobacteraeota bacterium]|nr:hypothetical protein [Candidatus Eremiobacteraeota bacterium]
MRFAVALLTATLLTGSLLACSSGYGSPVELRSSQILAKMRAGAGPNTATFGIYAVASGSVVNGYPFNDRSNGPPVCSVGSFNDLSRSDIAVDRNGDLLVADGGANTITVFKGPGLCGPKLGTIADPFGKAFTDVTSRDGTTIVAGYYTISPQLPGVAVCTLSGGCTRHLSLGLGSGYLFGVAVAPNGDCWASAERYHPINGFALVYFAHCQGKGVVATGFQRSTPGGIDIDANGNLVVIDASASPGLTVYSGCNPACTVVGGPFALKGCGTPFGHLDGSSNKFIVAEAPCRSPYAKLDVYSYSPSAVTYLYSITNGLTLPAAASAFSPNSKE